MVHISKLNTQNFATRNVITEGLNLEIMFLKCGDSMTDNEMLLAKKKITIDEVMSDFSSSLLICRFFLKTFCLGPTKILLKSY